MNVKQLKEELAKYPDDMDVVIEEPQSGFWFSSVESVRKDKINYKEEPDGKTLAKGEVVVISEQV